MNAPTITTATAHGLEVGDLVEIDISRPRPPWWRLIALYRWWRDERRALHTYVITDVGSSTSFTVEVGGSDEQPRP